MSCVSQENALMPYMAKKKKRETKFKAMASAGCSARAKIMLVRARQRGLPKTASHRMRRVPRRALRPLQRSQAASQRFTAACLSFMFLHTQKIHTAPVLSPASTCLSPPG